MSDEEPAGYLGGAMSDDPYAVEDPYGDADPYAATQPGDEDVVGLLGGATGEEELPALPAAEDASYTASDFMGGGEEGYADPYADPYADQSYDDPYALPPSSDYDDYEGYDEAASAESDPSYFDSMGHEDYDPHATDVATRTAEPDTQYDDSAPKTISQQDAESIIRRITTKRILPPDQEVKPPPRQLTPSGGGLRIWPILVVMLLLGGGTVWVFRQPLAEKFPELAPFLGVELAKPKPIDVIHVDPPEVLLKRKMLQKILVSELKAFGMTEEDLKAGPAKGPQDKPEAPGGTTPDDAGSGATEDPVPPDDEGAGEDGEDGEGGGF